MAEAPILYHYCSNFAFHSIILQQRVRLSLLSMSNDAKEGRHVLDVASRILPDNFAYKKDALEQLQQVISLVSAIGFCVSADGDVLSQWRAYADNAQGVAIGFDRDALKATTEQEGDGQIIVRLAPIAYEDKLLVEVLEPDLQPVMEHYKSGKMRWPRLGTILSPITEEEQDREKQLHKQAFSDLFHMLMRIANYAYMVKSPFFKEEREWRILALVTNLDGTLVLPGAQFQPSSEKLKPFRDVPLDGFSPSMVREIVLGPRNQTPDEVVRLFLNSQGFEHVSVRRSIGSYR